MAIMLILFGLFLLAKQLPLTSARISYLAPTIIERTFKVGEYVEISFSDRYSFLIILGKPKFYMNLQLASKRKFHSTTPGLYALGASGTVQYTALEAGTHKIFAWTFSDAKCKYIIALGKHEYNHDRVISLSPCGFIETDPDKDMNIKSDGLEQYTFVRWYNGSTENEITSEWGPFDKNVPRLITLLSSNRKEVKVTITSEGNSEFDYGEYDHNGLDASTIPFFYTAQDKKQNMLDEYYVPPEITDIPQSQTNSQTVSQSTQTVSQTTQATSPSVQTSSIPALSETKSNPPSENNNPSTPTQNPDNGDSDDNSDGGLSGGAWAGIGTGIAAGGGGIGGLVTFLVKKFKKNDDSTNEDDGKQLPSIENTNENNNDNNNENSNENNNKNSNENNNKNANKNSNKNELNNNITIENKCSIY